MEPVNFQAIFEAAPGLYLILSPDLTIIAVNDAYTAATMTRREEILGRNLFEVFPDNPDDQQADGVSNLRASLNSVLKNKASHTMAIQKYDIRNPDGTFEVRYWSPLNKPVLNARQDVVYIIHRVENVTEFIQLKKEQALKNDELEIRLKGMEIELYDRANEIQHMNSQLEEKITALEAANKEMEAFSYSVSHDLRAPIRIINSFTHIIKEDYEPRLDEEGKRLFNNIINETGKMGQLVDDLLAFSRLGRKEVQKSAINMIKLAKEVISETVSNAEEGSNVKITVDDLPFAFCDRSLIRQVLINLISNALKFTCTKPERCIKIGSCQESQSTVYFVKDNGAGFDMKYYDKLFGVFQRLHSLEEFPGTGIGLAIVQKIVVRHGGKIWAEGAVDKGATFYFSLPNKID